jgi:large subunit ribosomal protein L9
MKVVFLEDVPNVAEAGEMKEVADGYGRNFLIPRKLAVLADAKAANIIEARLKKKARIQAETEAEMRELAQQLEGKEVILKARSGAKGQLYGSITNADIAEELSKSTGLVVDKRVIELEEPIRQVGSYEIAIGLTKDIMPKIKVTIVGEEKEGKEKEKEKVKKKAKAEKAEEKGKKKAKAEKTEEKGKKKAKAEKVEEKVKKKAKVEKAEEKVKKTKKKVAGEKAKKKEETG